jgi:hypothetical protein
MKREASLLVSLLVLLGAVPAWADGITSMSASPNPTTTGHKIKVTLSGTLAPGKKCRIYSMLGEPGGPPGGQTVGVAESFPFTFEVSFKQPHDPGYIHAWTGTTGDLPCDGKSFNTTVKVTAGLVLQPGRVAASPCPPGWVVKAHEASSGFLTCVPRKPTTKIQCPPNTQYVETECMVGCRPVPN